MKKVSLAEENAAIEKAKRQRAVDELAEILCGGADQAPDESPTKVIKVDSETGTMQPVGDERPEADQNAAEADRITAELDQIEPIPIESIRNTPHEIRQIMPSTSGVSVGSAQQDPEKRSLQLHNAAISALDALLKDDIEDDFITEQVEILLDRLRDLRMNTFEHLVPWDKLAEGGAL